MMHFRWICLVTALTASLIAPAAAAAQPYATRGIRIDGGVGFGATRLSYTGPADGDEFLENNNTFLHATLVVGGRWAGYLDVTFNNTPFEERSQDGDFDRYALDSLGYRAYAAGPAFQYHRRPGATGRFPLGDLTMLGIGARVAMFINDREDRIPDAALTADLGAGIGLDARIVSYHFISRYHGIFWGARGGLDFAPLTDSGFTVRDGYFYSFILGLTIKTPRFPSGRYF